MPELPEVETVKRELEAKLTGACIRTVTLRRADLRSPFPKDMGQRLTNRRIERLSRRAKYMLFHLDSRDVLVAHLGMTGRFTLTDALPKTYDTHDHVAFALKDGRGLVFNDARRFGLMDIVPENALSTHALFADLGPEPLEKSFSLDYLEAALAKRSGPIKPVLMDQKLVVGVGNIYASEALFLAGISPIRKASKAAPRADKLVASVRQVLNAAIESGGSSLRDFVHISGQTGYFQHKFNVYDREGAPCPTCKTPIRGMRQAGRSTYYCPSCQK